MTVIYAIGIYAFVVLVWVFYLAVMNLAAHRNELHWFAKINAYGIVLPIGYLMDMALNLIVCTAFLRIPRDFVLTGTLKRYLINDNGWRGDVSAWLCQNLLNQFDPRGKHC